MKVVWLLLVGDDEGTRPLRWWQAALILGVALGTTTAVILLIAWLIRLIGATS